MIVAKVLRNRSSERVRSLLAGDQCCIPFLTLLPATKSGPREEGSNPPLNSQACSGPFLSPLPSASGSWAIAQHSFLPLSPFAELAGTARGIVTSQSALSPQPELESQARAEEPGPAALYWAKRNSGLYRADPRQELTVKILQELFDNLAAVGGVKLPKRRHRASNLTMVDAVASSHTSSSPAQRSGHTSHSHHAQPKHHHHHHHQASAKTESGGFWSGITSFMSGGGSNHSGGAVHNSRPHVNGLYMYGGVGCGKTALMDLFVESAPKDFEVFRTHFHDFMLDVHMKLRKYKGENDPLLRVADSIAKTTHVLALDEFFVTDVADAMILSRLFGRLWDRGVVLVATSNRQPDKLYEGGLQRYLFLPFIERLKAECVPHDMASSTDYRRLAQHYRGLYFTDPATREEDLKEEFKDCVEGAPVGPQEVQVQMGRHITVPLAGGPCALFGFEELCGKPVAAADFLALAENFHTLAISGVPIFTAATRTQAYRFVTLIDVMYEHRVRMLFSAESFPLDLFTYIITQSEAAADPTRKELPQTVVDDNLGFAKDRTMSRLTEMQSLEYLLAHAKAHAPHNILALQEAYAKEDH